MFNVRVHSAGSNSIENLVTRKYARIPVVGDLVMDSFKDIVQVHQVLLIEDVEVEGIHAEVWTKHV